MFHIIVYEPAAHLALILQRPTSRPIPKRQQEIGTHLNLYACVLWPCADCIDSYLRSRIVLSIMTICCNNHWHCDHVINHVTLCSRHQVMIITWHCDHHGYQVQWWLLLEIQQRGVLPRAMSLCGLTMVCAIETSYYNNNHWSVITMIIKNKRGVMWITFWPRQRGAFIVVGNATMIDLVW